VQAELRQQPVNTAAAPAKATLPSGHYTCFEHGGVLGLRSALLAVTAHVAWRGNASASYTIASRRATRSNCS